MVTDSTASRANTIVTHVRPDTDALVAVWILTRFGRCRDYELAFVPVGNRLAGARVIHVDTGGKEFDHHQTSDHTCAAKLAYESVFPDGDEPAVKAIVEYALKSDWYLLPKDDAAAFDLNAIIQGLNRTHPNEPVYVAETGFTILDAICENLRMRLVAESEYNKGYTFQSTFGSAFAVESGLPHIRDLAHQRGAKVVVFVDPDFGYRGYKANSRSGVDFSNLFERVRSIEPDADWFLHSSKELLLCGSPKAPDRRLSRLPLSSLVDLIRENGVVS